MPSFAVFEEAVRGRDLGARRPYLVGADDIPLPAEITLDGAVIRCKKPGNEASSLTLLFDAGPSGELMLRTCLLPEREQPYLLSLELARHRIMLFLNKLEEWLNCDLPADDPAMALFEQARQKFTAALAASGGGARFTLEEDRLASESLRLAIDASERLSNLVAELMLVPRLDAAINAAGGAAGGAAAKQVNFWTGVCVGREHAGAALQKVVAETFDFIVKPMRWTELEPSEGEYSFAKTDKWVEWAVRQANLPVVGGPLIDFRPGRTPEWLSIWENDYETLREVIFEHLKRVIGRYRKAVTRWTVAGGLHLNTQFPLTLEQMMDLTRLCVMVVKKLQPSAKVNLEIDQPFGEHYLANTRSAPPMLYAEMVSQQGIAADAYCLRVQMGPGGEGRSARDMMQLAAMLDAYSAFNKPLCLIIGAPSSPPSAAAPDPELGTLGAASEPDPGHWRKPWSQEMQAEWMTHALTTALSRPWVQSVAWQDLYDAPASDATVEMACGGLITRDGKPKAALRRLAAIRQGMRRKKPPTRIAPSEQPATPAWTEAGEG